MKNVYFITGFFGEILKCFSSYDKASKYVKQKIEYLRDTNQLTIFSRFEIKKIQIE